MSENSEKEPALQSLSIEPFKLVSRFWERRRLNAARVLPDTETIRVTATAKAEGASILIDGAVVQSGRPSQEISLSPGLSLVNIEVTSADGSATMEYVIRVYRPLETPDWKLVSKSCPWSPRDSAGELVFNDRMWIFGGYTPGLVSDVWHTKNGIDWEQAADIPSDSGVNIPICFTHNGRMWMTSQDGQFFSSADGQSWDLVLSEVPWKGRYGAGSATFNGRMWVLGGIKEGVPQSEVWSSGDGTQWKLETGAAEWSGRQLFGMVTVHDDKLWVIGGGISNYHPFRAYTDVWNSEDGRSWEQVTEHAPWPRRIWSNAVSYANRLWVVGGFHAEPDWRNHNDIWYSADGAEWHQLETESIWSERHEISVYVHDQRLWVIGGNAWPLMNDVWSLEIDGLTFVTQPVVDEFVGAEYTYRARADFNSSCDEVRYRLVESAGWLTINEETGCVRGTSRDAGEWPVTIEARDAAGETARQSYRLHVAPIGA
ncbi:MAG: cadherin-like beta sandwich domain-containing protein [Planctomycetota bacterium]|nr:cadherin-like beta sandwich domain-containing protein [Planctomycetota bacterium]